MNLSNINCACPFAAYDNWYFCFNVKKVFKTCFNSVTIIVFKFDIYFLPEKSDFVTTNKSSNVVKYGHKDLIISFQENSMSI